MPGTASGSEERAALDKLRMLRVAKDLFASEWYHDACDTLRFSEGACRTLGAISDESREERDEAMALIQKWAKRMDDAAPRDGPSHVAHVARRDFLLQLIDAKEAAGEVYERAAIVAPIGLRDEFHRLAAIDFRHAVQLRQLLVEEVQDEWRKRAQGEGATPR